MTNSEILDPATRSNFASIGAPEGAGGATQGGLTSRGAGLGRRLDGRGALPRVTERVNIEPTLGNFVRNRPKGRSHGASGDPTRRVLCAVYHHRQARGVYGSGERRWSEAGQKELHLFTVTHVEVRFHSPRGEGEAWRGRKSRHRVRCLDERKRLNLPFLTVLESRILDFFLDLKAL